MRSNPHIDGLVEASSRGRLSPSHLVDIRRRLAAVSGSRGFDLAIDFQGTRRSAAWIYLSGARFKAGRGGWRPGWQSTIRPDLTRHAVEVCADVCRSIAVPVADLEPELSTSSEDDARVARALAAAHLPTHGFVLLNPFSRWASKSLSVESATALVARMHRDLGVRAVLTGGPKDAERAAEVARRAGREAIVSMAGRFSLAEAFCLFRRAHLMVTCDSGPMHAAAALGTPVIALFGPTHPERTGPWGARHIVLQARRPADHHAYRHDPEGRFMGALSMDLVFDQVRDALLEGSGRGAARPAVRPR